MSWRLKSLRMRWEASGEMEVMKLEECDIPGTDPLFLLELVEYCWKGAFSVKNTSKYW